MSQVGNDAAAADFLRDLKNDVELKETVYVAAERIDEQFEDLRQNNEALEVWVSPIPALT